MLFILFIVRIECFFYDQCLFSVTAAGKKTKTKKILKYLPFDHGYTHSDTHLSNQEQDGSFWKASSATVKSSIIKVQILNVTQVAILSELVRTLTSVSEGFVTVSDGVKDYYAW